MDFFLEFADGSSNRFRQHNEALSPVDAIILVWSTQVDVSRRDFFFSWTFFLISQTVPPTDSGSLTRFVPIRCNCLGFRRAATDCVGVFPSCVGPYMREYADVSSPSSIGIGR